MKHIIRNENVLSLFDKPIENMRWAVDGEPVKLIKVNKVILRTYRDVLKMTARFDWNNDHGIMWRDILRKSARLEFEQFWEEYDSIKVAQKILVWKDVNLRLHEKVNDF